jgi:hypothetical protein
VKKTSVTVVVTNHRRSASGIGFSAAAVAVVAAVTADPIKI